MTATQAASVCTSLINSGYIPSVTIDGSGSWHVSATTPAVITQAQVNSFATAQGVTVDTYNVNTFVSFKQVI